MKVSHLGRCLLRSVIIPPMHQHHKAFRAGFNNLFVLHRTAEFWSVNSVRNYLSWWCAARFHLPSFYYSLLQLDFFYYSFVCYYILLCKLGGSWVYSPQFINIVKLLFLPLHVSEGKEVWHVHSLQYSRFLMGLIQEYFLPGRKKKEKIELFCKSSVS